jgi:hypothetical protein
MNRLTSTYLNQLQLLFWAVLIALAGSHARAASVADLTYINYGTYIEITDCSLTATGELNIPDSLEGLPVTIIGDSAFRECAGLVSITLPESLTTIGSYAFRECDALTSIYIPDSVSSMGSQAFNRCGNLQEVRLSESISSIGRNAFGYCYSLESIIIPSGISSLAGNAFLNCSSLRTVFFRGGLPNIGGSTFSGIAPDAVAYHIAGATGLDDSDLAPLTLVDVGQYSPFKEWLTGHGLGHDLDPEVDLSGDGVSVFEAFTQNLDPVAKNLSSLSFSTAGDQLAIDYYAMSPWVRYCALQSTNLWDWTDAGVSITAPDTMGRVTASTPMSGDARFIKMRTEFPVLYVSPGGAGSDYRPNQPGNINDALAAAPPGAAIRLLPGTYSRIDVNVSGMPEKPITLISDSTDPTQYAIIDGGNTTGEKGNQGMVISNADWLVIEKLKFQNCWENIIELDNSSYITVRGCDFKEGKQVVHAKAGTHHVLMEYNTWKQREEIWYEWTWADVHHSEVEDLKHYSGTFYGGPYASDQAYGAAVIRHNQGSHLYNWLAMWSNAPNLQANIEVYGNHTDYVRDNVIEPERYTFNLHVYHNEFNQTAASVFSLLHNEVLPWDDPSMALNGPMYVYGNVGSWDASDPVPPEAIGPYDYQPKYGVVKNCKWFTGEPVKFYHNSWKYNKFGLPNTVDNDRQMHHFNNIGVYDEGYSIQQSMQFVEWGNAFDYDFSDKAWQTHLLDKGQEPNGIVAPDPGWTDPANSDYRLQAGSVCIDAGAVIPGFTQSYDGAAPDIGAYEGDKLVEGPPFYIRVPPSLEAPTQVVVEQWDFSGANPETGMNGTTVSTWTTASPNSVPSAGVLRYADTMDSDWGGAQLLPDIDTSAIDQMIWTIQLADLNVSAGSNFRFSTLTSGGGDVRPELELTSWGSDPDYTFSPDMEYNGGTDELGGSHISLTGNQLGGPLTIVATWDFASNTMTLQVGDNAPVSITPAANMAATIGTITGFRMYPDSIAAGDYLDLDSVTIETVTEADGELGYVEKPRITRHRVAGNQLTLFWSWPLDPSTVQDGQIVITVDGRPVQVTGHSIAAPYRELILTTERSLEGAELEIDFDTFPTGDNGETATLWGSTLQLDVEASRRINF